MAYLLNNALMVKRILIPYILKKDGSFGLIIIDITSSDVKEEFTKTLSEFKQNYILISVDLTNILQPLDVAINKSLKYYMREC